MVRHQPGVWLLHADFHMAVHAIIFMCSTAGFNEVLQEDRGVNRLVRFTNPSMMPW